MTALKAAATAIARRFAFMRRFLRIRNALWRQVAAATARMRFPFMGAALSPPPLPSKICEFYSLFIIICPSLLIIYLYFFSENGIINVKSDFALANEESEDIYF